MKARSKVVDDRTIGVKAFRKTGIYPINKTVITPQMMNLSGIFTPTRLPTRVLSRSASRSPRRPSSRNQLARRRPRRISTTRCLPSLRPRPRPRRPTLRPRRRWPPHPSSRRSCADRPGSTSPWPRATSCRTHGRPSVSCHTRGSRARRATCSTTRRTCRASSGGTPPRSGWRPRGPTRPSGAAPSRPRRRRGAAARATRTSRPKPRRLARSFPLAPRSTSRAASSLDRLLLPLQPLLRLIPRLTTCLPPALALGVPHSEDQLPPASGHGLELDPALLCLAPAARQTPGSTPPARPRVQGPRPQQHPQDQGRPTQVQAHAQEAASITRGRSGSCASSTRTASRGPSSGRRRHRRVQRTTGPLKRPCGRRRRACRS